MSFGLLCVPVSWARLSFVSLTCLYSRPTASPASVPLAPTKALKVGAGATSRGAPPPLAEGARGPTNIVESYRRAVVEGAQRARAEMGAGPAPANEERGPKPGTEEAGGLGLEAHVAEATTEAAGLKPTGDTPQARPEESEVDARHVADVPVVEMRQLGPAHVEDVVGGQQEEDVVLEVTQASTKAAAVLASGTIEGRGAASAPSTVALLERPVSTTEHPPARRCGVEVQQVEEEPSVSIEDLGLNRPGIPHAVEEDMLEEEKLWDTQREQGRSLLKCLREATRLHERDLFASHKVSVFPFYLARYMLWRSRDEPHRTFVFTAAASRLLQQEPSARRSLR